MSDEKESARNEFWEKAKAELKAHINERLANVVTHRELIGWGIGIGGGLLAASLYLGSLQAKGATAAATEAKASVVEVQKDVRSLYRAVLTREPQKRLERGPTVAEPGGAKAP